MTISSETTKVQFSGPTSGALNISALQIQSDDDVLVTKTSSGVDTTLTKTTDYTINAGLTELTLVVELVSGESLTVSLDIELTQGTDFKNNRQNFENAETALDKLTLRAKQDSETLDRTLKLLVSSTLSDLTVPEPQAGAFLAWNSTEDALENSTTITGATVPSVNAPADTDKVLKGGSADDTFTLGAIIPDTGAGDATKIVKVNSGETGFEYGAKLPAFTASKQGAIVVQNAADDGFDYLTSQGTSGQVLTSNGADADPSFQDAAAGGAWNLLETQTASNSTSIDFTSNINGTYKYYTIRCINVIPATDGTYLGLRYSTDGGSSYISATNYTFHRQASDSSSAGYGTGGSTAVSSNFILASQIGSDTNESGYSSTIILNDPSNSSVYKTLNASYTQIDDSGRAVGGSFFGFYPTASAVDALRFFMGSGNIESGIFKLYGIS